MLVYLLVSQFLAKVGHDVTELGSADETIAVLVEHSEGFPDLLLAEKKYDKISTADPLMFASNSRQGIITR